MPEITLPSVASEGGRARYLQEIRKFPMLKPDEEYRLASTATPRPRTAW